MVNVVSANWENMATPPVKQNRMIASIDIGTNSLHMVIVRIEPTLPAFTMIAKEKETVRLGDRNLETGELKPEVIKKAIACLGRFQALAKSLEAESIIAVATSAVREAPNGREPKTSRHSCCISRGNESKASGNQQCGQLGSRTRW